MELSRLRVLFYFAAFLLGLSVCYIYAEDAPSTPRSANTVTGCDVTSSPALAPATHLLLWASPRHASFLNPNSGMHLSSIRSAPTPATPIASRNLLSEVETISQTHRRLLHIGRAKAHPMAKSRSLDDSAVLEVLSNRQQSGSAPAVEAR